MSWTNVADLASAFLSRHAKLVIALVFAVLVVFVPPARDAFVALGTAVIRDVSTSRTEHLTPAATPIGESARG